LNRTKKVWSIGLTGGIGCGKSKVAECLEQLGLRRLDTDRVAREVVEPGTEGLRRLVAEFGPAVLLADDSLDRKRLAQIVFADAEKRERLERILHPLIWERVETFLKDCKSRGDHSVTEVPLLFENQRRSTFDTVWVVATTPELQKHRLAERNQWSDAEIESRIASQMPLKEKIQLADQVLMNTDTLDALCAQVDKLWSRLESGAIS